MRKPMGVFTVLSVFAAVTIAACHGPSPVEVLGPRAGTFSIAVGEEIDIHMQNVGPGTFISPPTLSGSALQFLEETGPVGGNDPGGIEQLFHFKGVATGTTIITFQNTGGDTPSPITVVDTVTVH